MKSGRGRYLRTTNLGSPATCSPAQSGLSKKEQIFIIGYQDLSRLFGNFSFFGQRFFQTLHLYRQNSKPALKLSFVTSEAELIQGLQAQDRGMQKLLFSRQSRKMLALCRRYVKDEFEAENCLMQGFARVFSAVTQFRTEGNLEGWIRKIMVRECLQHLRRNHPMRVITGTEEAEEIAFQLPENLDYALLLDLIHQLPAGYRMVFNLFAVEGYRHAEIAEMLGISEGSSRSQLNGARKQLKTMLSKIGVHRIDHFVS